MRIAYVNGRFVPHHQARVSIEDRGYQFADAVYEVVPIMGRRIFELAPHMDRLERSLQELEIAMPVPRRVLEMLHREMVRRNRIDSGIVYTQVSRGVAPRKHAFPNPAPAPALVMTAKPMPVNTTTLRTVRTITAPDIRWGRRDIKSTGLLANCLANEQAHRRGAAEAILVDTDGNITEASHSNVWIVDQDGVLRTRALSQEILAGCTRLSVAAVAQELGIAVQQSPFSVAELKAAQEIFITSTTVFIAAVEAVDDTTIGTGEPGAVTRRLMAGYEAMLAQP